MRELVIGTRNSKLALWQAEHIKDLLAQTGISARLDAMETKGDKVQNVALHKIGSKGVFTEELEDKLLSGEIDLAVHSAKDVQSSLKQGLHLIAFTQREYAGDVLLSTDAKVHLGQETPLRIGTSSNRRKALLARHYSQHQQVEMRGNLQTRLKKMQDGQCDAMILAFAGVHRMEMDEYIVERLDLNAFIPPVGQASIAIEASPARLGEELLQQIRRAVNHAETEACILCERSFLAKMEGGCSVPVFGNAVWEDKELRFVGGVVSLDGNELILHDQKANAKHPEQLGHEAAQQVIARGGKDILKAIRAQLDNPKP